MERVALREMPAHAQLEAVMGRLNLNDNPFGVLLLKSEIRLIIRGLELLFEQEETDQMRAEDIMEILYSMTEELKDQTRS